MSPTWLVLAAIIGPILMVAVAKYAEQTVPRYPAPLSVTTAMR